MQSLTGKERVLTAFDDKRSSAKFFRLICAPLPFVAASASIFSGGNIADATSCAMMGWVISINAQNGESGVELEILSKCVGRPRLAKAVANRRTSEGRYHFLFERLSNLDRLNRTQKALLYDFFTLRTWQMSEEDRIAAYNLLNRAAGDPSKE